MRNRRKVLLVAAALGAASFTARAQTASPVRVIVPFTPGTGIDAVARALAPRLSERLGRPFVVENIAGASGNIGTQQVARAAPDGRTLLVTVNTFVMNQSLFRNLPYDPVRDFEPIALTSWGSLLLVANPAAGFNTVTDLVNKAKASAEKINYASPGVGTPHHLAMELFALQAGITLTHVSYKGTAGAVTDVLAGHVPTMFLPVHVALPHLRAGKLKALAAGSPARLPQVADVPTLTELGYPALSVDMWYGVLAPKGTPADLVAQLNQEINQVLGQPAVKDAFDSQGMVPATATPQAFGEIVQKDLKRWAEVVQKAKISAE